MYTYVKMYGGKLRCVYYVLLNLQKPFLYILQTVKLSFRCICDQLDILLICYDWEWLMFFAVSQDNFFSCFSYYVYCTYVIYGLCFSSFQWNVIYISIIQRDKFHTSISMMEYNLLDQAGSVDRSRVSVFLSMNATGCIINLTQHDEQLPIPM